MRNSLLLVWFALSLEVEYHVTIKYDLSNLYFPMQTAFDNAMPDHRIAMKFAVTPEFPMYWSAHHFPH